MIVCQNCSSNIFSRYKDIGLKYICPNCESLILIKVALNTNYPKSVSGYGMTFTDFLSLFKYNYKNKFIDLIKDKLNLDVIKNESGKIVFETKENELVPNQILHELIQSDSLLQYKIYQMAMSEWR